MDSTRSRATQPPKDFKPPSKLSKDSNPSRDIKQSRDFKRSEDLGHSKNCESSSDLDISKKSQLSKNSIHSRDSKSSRDIKLLRNPKLLRDYQHSRDAKLSRDYKRLKDAEVSRYVKSTRYIECSNNPKHSGDFKLSRKCLSSKCPKYLEEISTSEESSSEEFTSTSSSVISKCSEKCNFKYPDNYKSFIKPKIIMQSKCTMTKMSECEIYKPKANTKKRLKKNKNASNKLSTMEGTLQRMNRALAEVEQTIEMVKTKMRCFPSGAFPNDFTPRCDAVSSKQSTPEADMWQHCATSVPDNSCQSCNLHSNPSYRNEMCYSLPESSCYSYPYSHLQSCSAANTLPGCPQANTSHSLPTSSSFGSPLPFPVSVYPTSIGLNQSFSQPTSQSCCSSASSPQCILPNSSVLFPLFNSSVSLTAPSFLSSRPDSIAEYPQPYQSALHPAFTHRPSSSSSNMNPIVPFSSDYSQPPAPNVVPSTPESITNPSKSFTESTHPQRIPSPILPSTTQCSNTNALQTFSGSNSFPPCPALSSPLPTIPRDIAQTPQSSCPMRTVCAPNSARQYMPNIHRPTSCLDLPRQTKSPSSNVRPSSSFIVCAPKQQRNCFSEFLNALGEKLVRAAERGKIDSVRKLLEMGADVNFFSHNEWTALHKATNRVHINCVSLLLLKGADVNARTSDGLTPLHIAAYNDFSGQCMQLLLDAGADVGSTNRSGRTALHCAAESGNGVVARKLCLAGAYRFTKDNKGRRPLDVAATECVRKILIR